MGILRKLLVLSFTIFFVVEPIAEETCNVIVLNKLPYTMSMKLNLVVDTFWSWTGRDIKTVADIPLDFDECIKIKISSRLDENRITIAYRSDKNSYADMNKVRVCSNRHMYRDPVPFFFAFQEGPGANNREISLNRYDSDLSSDSEFSDCSTMSVDSDGKAEWVD